MNLSKLKIVLLIVTLLIIPITGFCQTEKFCQESLWYKKFQAGDVIKVDCDTAYLVNRFTFQYYQKLFSSYRSQDQRVKSLTSIYGDMTVLYEKRIAAQDEEYQQLQKSFDQLVENSKQMTEITDKKLVSINASLVSADNSIQAAKTNLEEVSENIKREIRVSRRQKLKMLGGGIAIGAVSTSLLFLAVK
jgi:uncharacterized protein (DUF342 family)